MRRVRQFGDRRRVRNGDIAKRIKKFDRHLEFLAEKFAHVGSAGASATKKNALRRVALLLGAIMTDGAHHFGVKSRHGAAHEFGNARDFGVCRFGISTTETDKAIALLAKFRSCKRLVEFLRYGDGDGTAANRNAARENFLRLDEKQIGGARADIDKQ